MGTSRGVPFSDSVASVAVRREAMNATHRASMAGARGPGGSFDSQDDTPARIAMAVEVACRPWTRSSAASAATWTSANSRSHRGARAAPRRAGQRRWRRDRRRGACTSRVPVHRHRHRRGGAPRCVRPGSTTAAQGRSAQCALPGRGRTSAASHPCGSRRRAAHRPALGLAASRGPGRRCGSRGAHGRWAATRWLVLASSSHSRPLTSTGWVCPPLTANCRPSRRRVPVRASM